MLYLILAILCNSMFSVLFRIGQDKGVDNRQAIMFNYMTALAISIFPQVMDLISDGPEAAAAYMPTAGTMALSAIEGILFALAFYVMDRCTWRAGVAITTVTAKTSLLIPTVLGFLLLHEPVPPVAPILLILAALAMIVLPARNQPHDPSILTDKTDSQRRRLTIMLIILLFVMQGTVDFILKVSQNAVARSCADSPETVGSHLSALMSAIFLMAAISSFTMCLKTGSFRSGISLRNIAAGVLLGAVNTLATRSTLMGLSLIRAGVFYPVLNVGCVVTGSLIGMAVFGERLTKIQTAGLLTAAAAVGLIF